MSRTAVNVAPIRRSITVEAPQERAFRVFTENIDLWWPREHKLGQADLKRAVLEPKVNGRWYEQLVDGSECDWGKVLAWEPPRRVLLAWQISAQWQYDPSLLTEVEVVFTPDGPKRTRVELEHRNLERFGDTTGTLKPSLDEGWGKSLDLYAGVVHR